MSRNSLRTIFLLAVACCALLGATARGGTIDVTTLGAIPDDEISDSAIINSAINGAAAGDTVYIPAGRFNLGQKIVARSGVTLLGAGPGVTNLRYTGAAGEPLLQLNNVSDVNVAQLTLDANNSTTATAGISASNSSNLDLHHLDVRNFRRVSGVSPHGVHFVENVTRSAVRASTFENIGTTSAWGAGVRLSHGSSFNRVLDNTVRNTGRGGILVNDNSTDLLIKNNTVTGSGGTGLGIELWGGAHRSVVEDNRIDHWLSLDGSNQVAVRRNVVSDKTGVYKYAGLELVDSSDVVFTDNVVDGGQRIGISVSGPLAKERVFWGHNTIRGASTWGIQIQGETGKASKQYFYQNTFDATYKQIPETLYAPQGHGVRFNGDADDIVFDSNVIGPNQGAGIQLTGGRLTSIDFVNNAVTGNAGNAVLGSGVTDLGWTGNTVSGNGNNNPPGGAGLVDLPAVDLTGATDLFVGQEVQFTLSFANPADAFTSVLWDFGEGIPSTELSPTHAYRTPGTYRVTVIGWDADGRGAVDQMHVTVGALPEPGAAGVVLVGIALLGRRRRSRGGR